MALAAASPTSLPAELRFLLEPWSPEEVAGIGVDNIKEFDEHARKLDAGYAELSRGRPAPALVQFRSASRMSGEGAFVEVPNTLPWVGEAEALCRLGRKAEGRTALANFRCAVDIENLRRRCESLETARLKPRGGLGFPARCYQELCAGELIRGYYDGSRTPQPTDEERAEPDLRPLAARVGRICAEPAPVAPKQRQSPASRH
jgi:hypothetical protein